MKKFVFSLSLLLGLFTFASCDNTATNDHADTEEQAEDVNDKKETGMKDKDMNFMVKAASGGLYEVQAAQIALTKSTDQAVKDFAQQMINDHGPVNDELKTLATNKNVTIPSAPGEDHKEHMDKLNSKTGADFDKEYMDQMAADHKDAADLFEDAAEGAEDADVKAFAGKHVGTIKAHLEHAKTLDEKMEDKK